MPKKPILIGLLGLLVAAAAYLARSDDFAADTPRGTAAIEDSDVASESDAPPWDGADWAIFRDRVTWALDHRVDTLPIGEAVAAIGRTFVGTPYVPHTLEAEGPEHLVIDFRGLDCVTFVETALTTARFVREPGAAGLLERPARAEARYDALLTQLRYRGGRLDGYPSRLHYFTEWISDGERKGLLRDVTRELGGVRDTEPVDFMTTHADAYRQLAGSPEDVAALRSAEERLSAAGRWYVPQDRIDQAAPDIHDGDVIAATSTVPGLDVAHTGIAIWIDGTLHLMHAPLVGDSVQISEESLAQRIRRISGQDGIIVARPVEPSR
jgi:hypothetical protein